MTLPATTQAGVILGTAAYMSPEQARGKPVDKRSDVWAFGCVLFEMLTGRRAFEGEDISDTLANVLKRSPTGRPAGDVPRSLRTVVRGCLEKDPHGGLRTWRRAVRLRTAHSIHRLAAARPRCSCRGP